MTTVTSVKPFTGRHMLAILVAFFGVVFAVNITLAVIASRSWTGLVVENSYVASQSFNKDVEALKKSEALGVIHSLHYEKGQLLLNLQGADGKALNTDKVQISIGRPVDNGEDQILTAMPAVDGQFAVPAKLGNGVWAGELSALIDGKDQWRRPFKLTVTGE